MNNFVIGLKKFITNKNVVTIVGVLVVLVVLYYGYVSNIEKQTNPITVPVASKTIEAKTEITEEDVKYVQLPGSMIDENVLTSSVDIIGKYTNLNVTIPEGSVFYNSWLVEESKLPGNWIEQLNGDLGYYMSVDIESTLGNSVLPNTYIDIYMKAEDENGTVMFGKLLKNIKVLVVHDSAGQNVFDNAAEIAEPAKIGFAVNQDLHNLLHKIEYLEEDVVELVIAPRGETVPTKDYVIVASSTLRDYVDAQTITVEEDKDPEEEEKTEENPTIEDIPSVIE